ncbi:MAG: YceI family protein [Pyrinomonadaceae bacterium]|nr:YceI family protein [Pyrinomonadaceae bacterium]
MRKTATIAFATLAIALIAGIAGFTNRTAAEGFSTNFQNANFSDEDKSGTYTFDTSHTTIGFRVKHMGLVDVPGYFRTFSGTAVYNAKDAAKSSVEFSATVTSIDTGVERRDNHLRSKDFFEVDKYPTMTFKSTKVEKKENQLMITGDFTLKGVTKQITFPFEVAGFAPQKDGMKMGVTAQTTINRRDYGIDWGSNMENGVAMVSDEVRIDLQIEAAMKKETVEVPK